jgi:hypothetical protein
MTERVVHWALLQGSDDPSSPERYWVLDLNVESSFIAMLIAVFQSGHPRTDKELLKTIWEKSDPKLTRCWIHAFLGTHPVVLQDCRSLLLEDAQLTIPRDQLDKSITTMTILIVEQSFELSSILTRSTPPSGRIVDIRQSSHLGPFRRTRWIIPDPINIVMEYL